MTKDQDLMDEKFKLLIACMQAFLDRLPTEDEVVEFINGDSETRKKILRVNQNDE